MKRNIYVGILLLFLIVNTSFAQESPPSPPNLVFENVNLSSDSFEEGEEIKLQFTIRNNDSQSYSNLRIVAKLGTESDGRPGSSNLDFKEIGGINIENINSGESLNHSINFTSDAGNFVVQLVVVINNQELQNTIYTTSLEIFTAPVGDNASILMSIMIILTTIMLFIFIQWLYDRIRLRQNGHRMKNSSI